MATRRLELLDRTRRRVRGGWTAGRAATRGRRERDQPADACGTGGREQRERPRAVEAAHEDRR